MTEKQQNILMTALRLFAEEGFDAIPTSRIAREAGVSEGLIFRHFGNKEGLLKSIVNHGIADTEVPIKELSELEDPNQVMEGFFDFVERSLDDPNRFWPLQMSLKYQKPELAAHYDNHPSMQLLNTTLEKAFEKMGYAHPFEERRMVNIMLTGIFLNLSKSPKSEQKQFIQFIKNKYQNHAWH
mgnify:CR=1 FL=1